MLLHHYNFRRVSVPSESFVLLFSHLPHRHFLCLEGKNQLENKLLVLWLGEGGLRMFFFNSPHKRQGAICSFAP